MAPSSSRSDPWTDMTSHACYISTNFYRTPESIPQCERIVFQGGIPFLNHAEVKFRRNRCQAQFLWATQGSKLIRGGRCHSKACRLWATRGLSQAMKQPTNPNNEATKLTWFTLRGGAMPSPAPPPAFFWRRSKQQNNPGKYNTLNGTFL